MAPARTARAIPRPEPERPVRRLRRSRVGLLEFARDPLHASLALAQAPGAGDVVRLDFNGFYLLSHPDHLQHVLQDRRENFWRGTVAHKRSGGFFGNSLFFRDGEAWRDRRRLMTPAFSPKAMPGYAETMVGEIDEMLRRWEASERDDSPLGIHAEMKELTGDVICATMFSASIRQRRREVARAMAALGDYVARSLRTPVPIPGWLPIPRNVRLQRARRSLDRLVGELVEERRRALHREDGSGDLLDRLLEAQRLDAGAFDDEELRDELGNIFAAGHETTANTLTWAFYLLSKMPDVRRRLEQEIAQVLGGRTPGHEDLERLVYTERVVCETLRLYPPAWLMIRESHEEDVIGDVRIPARSTLLLSPYVTHRRPDFWENPEGFDPERFAPEQVERRHRFAWCPFGGGPRVCLGKPLAMAEAKLTLAMVAQRYRLELLPGPPARPVGRLALEPGRELFMRLRRRSD